MKKEIIIPVILIILILFIPIPTGVYKDGGTRTFTALTYKIVRWNKMIGVDYIYNKTSIYFFPKNFLSIDELWEYEDYIKPEIKI